MNKSGAIYGSQNTMVRRPWSLVIELRPWNDYHRFGIVIFIVFFAVKNRS